MRLLSVFVVTNCFVCHCAGLGSRLLKTLHLHSFIIQIVGKQIVDIAAAFLGSRLIA